jgi:hypothetical protein
VVAQVAGITRGRFTEDTVHSVHSRGGVSHSTEVKTAQQYSRITKGRTNWRKQMKAKVAEKNETNALMRNGKRIRTSFATTSANFGCLIYSSAPNICVLDPFFLQKSSFIRSADSSRGIKIFGSQCLN